MNTQILNGTFSTRTDAAFLNPRSDVNVLAVILNGGASQTFASTNSIGLWEVKRTNSTTLEVWKDGALVTTFTVTATGRATGTLLVGAERFVASINLFSIRRCGLVGVGGVKGSWQTEWAARRTAIGL